MSETNEDEDVEVYDTRDDDGDDKTDEGEPRTSLPRTVDYGLCKDCGFRMHLTNLDEHEFCKGNKWRCHRCEKEWDHISASEVRKHLFEHGIVVEL